MGISRLESIIRNSNNNTTKPGASDGIYNMCLKDLPPVPNARKYPHIRTVVIDTSEFIYKSIIGGDHTSGLLNFLEKMFRCQLLPIFVFDGKPPKEKTRIIEERKRVKERARERIISLKEKLNQADELLNIVESGLNNSGLCTQLQSQPDVQPLNTSLESISSLPDIANSEITSSDSQINYNRIREILRNEPLLNGNNNIINTNDLLNNGYDCYLDNYIEVLNNEYTSNDIMNDIREDIIDRLRNKISNMINESVRVSKKTVAIQETQYKDIKTLFNHFNIPFIHAGVEAEMICAALVKLGVADYCIGNDMDLFALGCPRIIRNINFRDDSVDLYYLETILDNLDLSYPEFVDLCIALGSDYTGRLGGVKNFHILEYIQKYRSIENVIANIDEINTGLIGCMTDDGQQRVLRIPEPFNFIEARAIFATEFTIDQINKITSCPLTDIYENCANRCLELRANFAIIDDISQFCQTKCGRLNNMLITKKINIIIWSNLFQDEKLDGFTLVKPKKTSPININGRRGDIINDIRERNRKNFSRVAFGSSPNHAMVMIA
jgi:5'-3' exonuclease